MRLFAAIAPPQETLDRIEQIQKAVHREVRQKGSYPHRDKLHITLKFWGEELSLPTVKMLIEESLVGAAKIPILLDSLDGFPAHSRLKRVAFLNIAQPEPLIKIMRAMGEPEPHPHLTLSRYMQHAELPRLKFEPIAFDAESVILYDSIQFGADRRYVIQGQWPLM